MNVKKSFYNYEFQISPQKYLLFNTFSSALLLLNKSEFEEYCGNTILSDNLQQLLFLNGFIIDNDESELDKIKLIRKIKYLATDNSVYQILPTTFCNAKCYYCYEDGYVCERMTDVTAHDLTSFIKRNSRNDKSIQITWYGGEPLLEFNRICSISSELINWCSDTGIEYTASMISNGSLVNTEVISGLKKAKIKKIQITLDGMFDEYEARKRFQANTFEKVINNIKELIQEEILVIIRLNVDKNNVESIIDTIHFLNTNIGKSDYLLIYPAPIYSCGAIDEKIIQNNKLDEAFSGIYDALIETGYYRSVFDIALNYVDSSCSAVYLNSFSIAPNGKIYKCQHFIGDESQIIGDVKGGLVYNRCYAKWVEAELNEKCMQCKLLPMCQGGCEASSKLNVSLGRCTVKSYIFSTLSNSLIKLINKESQKNADY